MPLPSLQPAPEAANSISYLIAFVSSPSRDACPAADSTGTTVDAGLQPEDISGGVRRRLQALARSIGAFVTGGRKLRADLLLGGDPYALGAPELGADGLLTAVGAELPAVAVDPRETCPPSCRLCLYLLCCCAA